MKLPAQRFYWAVIEASGLKSSALPPGVWPLLEEDLPVGASELWAIGVPIDDHALLACALPRSELAEHTTELELTPDAVPDWVKTPVDPTRLNLLVGDYEPAAIRTRKRHRRLTRAGLTLLASLLCVVGLERRSQIWREEARSLEAASEHTIASVSPGWGPDDLALALNELKLALPGGARLPGDAAVVLANVLGGWPIHVQARVQSVSASAENASVSVLIPQSSDAAAFVGALHPPDGWKLEEPRLVNVNDATRVNVELRRSTP